VLHFLEGKPQTAIAEELGVSRPAVPRRIKTAVEELRGHLAEAGLPVSAAGLAGMLASQAGEAALTGLVAELGRVALAGGPP